MYNPVYNREFYCKMYKILHAERYNIFFYSRNQMSGLLTDSLVHKRRRSLLCVTSCTTTNAVSQLSHSLFSLNSPVTFSVTNQSSTRRTKQCNNSMTVSFERGGGIEAGWRARVSEHDTRNRTLSGIVQPNSRYRQCAVDIDPQRRLVSATKASLRTGFNET